MHIIRPNTTDSAEKINFQLIAGIQYNNIEDSAIYQRLASSRISQDLQQNLHMNKPTPRLSKRKITSPDAPSNPAKKSSGPNNHEILRAICDMKSVLQAEIGGLGEKIDLIERAMESWKEEKAVIVAKQSELEARLDRLERQEKMANIVITGLPVVEGPNPDVRSAVNDLLSTQLKRQTVVQDAYQIRLKSGESKIIAKLPSVADKRIVMATKKALPEKVFISDDLIRKDQFVLFKVREYAKSQRKPGTEVKMGKGRVYINGSPHIWDDAAQVFVTRKN